MLLHSLFVMHASRVHKMQQSAFTEVVLADGAYDAIVVDAERVEDGVRLELAITAGPNKGDVVAVRATNLTMDPVNALGIPARIVVTNNSPRVELEP